MPLFKQMVKAGFFLDFYTQVLIIHGIKLEKKQNKSLSTRLFSQTFNYSCSFCASSDIFMHFM